MNQSLHKQITKAFGVAIGLCATALSLHAGAADVRFRLPLAADSPRHYYYDHTQAGNGLQAWNCSAETYDDHNGTDYSGLARGTPIYAGAGGTIYRKADGFGDGYVGSPDGGGFGNHVALTHSDGTVSWYGHMTNGSVTTKSTGASIACGEQIGGVGTSGSSSGLHLHFEPRRSNVGFDPYAGSCSSQVSWWVNQGSGNPSITCQAGETPSNAWLPAVINLIME
jgi:murein DD-endopeptidase MepM/ murein hydrolase activator NlpD